MISGNREAGLTISTGVGFVLPGSVVVQGNLIGVNAQATARLANGTGLEISFTSNAVVGGTTAAARNVISANTAAGVSITSSSTNNHVLGNYIGTDGKGTKAIANGQGVFIANASNNTIGGAAAGAGNLISGNSGDNVRIDQADNNTVQGNRIGTNAAGTAVIGNGASGVLIEFATGNQIGGTGAGMGNLISGNPTGVRIDRCSNNQLQGNLIGTAVSGNRGLANASGVLIQNESSGNLVGGLTAGARNVISGNVQTGVKIESSTNNNVQGNYIGTSAAGTAALPNCNVGIRLDSANDNTIGGTLAGAGNLISGHTIVDATGVLVRLSNNNKVQGNHIGTNAAGAASLGNRCGIKLENSQNNQVGGVAAEARNIISGNSAIGVLIQGSNGTIVQGNFIGTNAAGSATIGSNLGVQVANSSNVTVGGLTAQARNIISGNLDLGVDLASEGVGTGIDNRLIGNYIGTNADGCAALGNLTGGDDELFGEDCANWLLGGLSLDLLDGGLGTNILED